LSQRKRVRQRNKPPSKQAQQKPNSKAGQLVGYRADLLNLRIALKLKLQHFTEGGVDQAAAAERQKKTNKYYPTSWTDYDRPSA
jgi:hypothetical protein